MKVIKLHNNITSTDKEHLISVIQQKSGSQVIELTNNLLRFDDVDNKIVFSNIKSVVIIINNVPEYSLASREIKKSDTYINIGDILIGGKKPIIIAGPCSVENYEQMNITAGELSKMGIRFLRGGAYKPRTSPYSFQGLEGKGLELLFKMKEKYGLKIVTEVMSSDKIDEVADVADILQIGSRNMFNYPLLKALGKLQKPVLLKRGMAAKMKEFLLSAEYILKGGNVNVILCERGIKTFETATRNTLDLNVVPHIKQLSHLPIIVDPSHGTGVKALIAPMSAAAMAAGANGLEIEVHYKPQIALSDRKQSLTLNEFKELLKSINFKK